jgi:hypothetical protein
VVFDTCLKTLAKGKAPGPDKVPNEILQALPDVYLEPLLRWLRAGRKGYMVGALAAEREEYQEEYQISDITYADDVDILTGGSEGLENMKHQASKLSHYANWGDLIVNNTKTTVTEALHETHPDSPHHENTLSMQLRAIKMQGQSITYRPLKDPFRHLGVYLTMDLNYTHRFKLTVDKIKKQVQSLRWSYASTSQRRRIIETCIRPAITYAFCAVPIHARRAEKIRQSDDPCD